MKVLKNDVIAYTVSRVMGNNFYISVQNGEVCVSAPWYLSKEKIQAAVEEKAKWISEKMREYENKAIQKRNYVIGKKVKIFGEDFALHISFENIKLPKLEVQENKVNIALPSQYKKLDYSDIVGILLEKMYDRLASKEIENIMEKTRIMLGFAPEDYEIRRMKNCIAKCGTDKKIAINPDITVYSKKAIEYVVLHEFCHLKYKTHAKGFYEMLEAYMPDYERRAKEIIGKEY